MNAWPHQLAAVAAVESAIADEGYHRVAVCIPTGGGKTYVMAELVKLWLTQRMRVVLYSNRTFLIEQLSRDLAQAGILHGVRAPGQEDMRELPFQVASIQTAHGRGIKRKTEQLHDAHRVLVDECHVQVGPSVQAVFEEHLAAGASIVGFTATPFGLRSMYDKLLVCGTTSELRACGALVPAVHFAPDEPDFRAYKIGLEKAKITEGEAAKLMEPKRIFGRVWDWFEQINPQRRPTILFAPGLEESIWYAERFTKMGVRAAHIDGDDVWLDGEFHASTPKLRESLLEESASGRTVVLCNRFVLREGINAPWLSHGILATVFGSLQSYLQSGGRLLRAHPGIDHVTIQDHGGNWWRHGSLNEDREWDLKLDTDMAFGMRADRIRNGAKPEPFRCPNCGRVWGSSGNSCHPAKGGCGYVLTNVKRSRPVVSTDGKLREMIGPIFRPHRISKAPNGAKIWERMYWRSRTGKGKRTFRAAMALFAQENNWGWPDRSWPFMPTEERDFYELVEDVPFERLTVHNLENRGTNGQTSEATEDTRDGGAEPS